MRAPRDVLLLTALAGSLLLVGLGAVALTDRDEGANAEAAREMLEQASWITPTLGGAPRFAKPALVYWLTAGAYTVLGVGETAARLPSAVAALLLVLVQYAFARWAYGRDVGWRAALVLLLSVEYVAIGRMALTDATLALFTTLAAYAFMRGWWAPPPRGRWYALGWVAAGLAALTKGPVGLLLPLAGVLVYLGIAGGLRQAWREAWPLRGLALLLLVALPWYVAMFWLHGWDYAARARGETLGRVLRPVTGPGGTALFYLPVLLVGFFPWSAFLPEAVRAGLRQARARARQSRREAVSVFAAAWLVAGLVLFSLAQTRLPHYVLPLFPAAALLVAASWPARPSRLSRVLLAGTGIALGAVLAGAWLASGQVVRLLAPAYPAAAGATLPASALVVAALTAGAGAGALVRDGQRLFRMLAVLATVVLAIGFQTTLPSVQRGVRRARGGARGAGRPHRARLRHARRGRSLPAEPALLRAAAGDLHQRSGQWGPPGRRAPRGAGRPARTALRHRAGRARARAPAAIGALPVVETRGGYVLLASDAAATGCAA